ncbi:MAG: tetratricopeptide repeat protein [Acidobacteriota bacterium]|nr:tetratricopeptide repeat protein [Acidobacteriota bacterium]
MAGRVPGVVLMRYLLFRFSSLAALLLLACFAAPSLGQTISRGDDARRQQHESQDWQTIAHHLVDLQTASRDALLLQGDILRARRFPYDALDYYNAALQREPRDVDAINRIGVTQLQLNNLVLARASFQRALKLNRRSAEAWNNLGAIEYLEKNYAYAESDYRHAVKLRRDDAIYHSNLAVTYFDQQRYDKGRREMATAMQLDPAVYRGTGGTGVSAHVMTPEDEARFNLEMARVYAQAGNTVEMLTALSKAARGGLDIATAVGQDRNFAPYRNDPRLLTLLDTARPSPSVTLTGELTGYSNIGHQSLR